MKLLNRNGNSGRSVAPASVLQNQVNRVFRDIFEDWGLGAQFATEGMWQPTMDLAETKDEYLVTLELPGVDSKQVEISAVGNELSIRGEIQEEEQKDERAYHARERRFGSFVRALQLPSNVDADKVRADFKNGLLKITLPKSEDAKPRLIKVNAE